MVTLIQYSCVYRTNDNAHKVSAFATARYKVFSELATKCIPDQQYTFSIQDTDIAERFNEGYNVYTCTLELRTL